MSNLLTHNYPTFVGRENGELIPGRGRAARRRLGHPQGITLNVKDLINFNKHVLGDHLFIMD